MCGVLRSVCMCNVWCVVTMSNMHHMYIHACTLVYIYTHEHILIPTPKSTHMKKKKHPHKITYRGWYVFALMSITHPVAAT